ncbi:S41 family peptidase [Fluviicola sp.]|uniref:S41 family peptidase n=1 Tax=Fluviicola sp. TaxID=1917219 RepID=UPI0026069FC2|nr:S41 family peptidase [Fluviicola sp.]
MIIVFQTANAQDNPQKYLEEAIGIMKQNSVNKGKINWDKLSKEAMDSLLNKKTNEEVYPIIIQAITQLGDYHSKFVQPEIVQAYMKTYNELGFDFPYPQDSLIDDQIAYITLPALGNLNAEDWKLYVSDFYKKTEILDSKNPKAWVIDLRENDGGMFSPMFKAIQPFLDVQKAIGSKDTDGQINYFTSKNEHIFFGNHLIATITIPTIKLKNNHIPVFILVSKKTASSGEFVAASFVGQKNAKIIGVNTQGLTSDNSDFQLSDGAILILTTGNLVDRKEHEYSEIGKGISPDIEVKTDELTAYINAVKEKLKP